MSKILRKKIPIDTVGGDAIIITELGKGGQGTVYKVKFADKEYALKWYHKAPSNEFYKNLKNNISKGSPNDNFLWPKYLTKKNKGNFGYLMDLRSPEYKDFGSFLLAKTHFKSVDAIINAALNICQGFRELHNKGYSYQDLNDGNFFINPENGDVLICDNDNVAPFGSNMGVLGKCRYMAPEVVMREKTPDVQSDRYSLTVVLFLLFFNNHPLEGEKIANVACMTEKNEKIYYGSNALFIYDIDNDSNRPVSYIHKNVIRLWPAFPEYVRGEFTKQLSQDLLKNPSKRQTEKEWINNVLLKMKNELSLCPKCATELFINTQKSESQVQCTNSKCKHAFNRPPIIQSGKHNFVIYKNKLFFEYLVNKDSLNFKDQVGIIVESVKRPGIFGLKNQSKNNWVLTTKSGENKNIEPDGTCPLLVGNIINFGNGTVAKII